MLDIPGVPVVTMYRLICFTLLIAVITHGVKSILGWIRSAPLAKPMVALFIFGIISAIINMGSEDSGFLAAFNILVEIVTPVFTFCYYFSKINGAKQQEICRKLIIFYGLIAIYGTFAYFIEFNPYIEFLDSTSKTGRILTRTYEGTLRGLRAQGTISHPITFGGALVIILASVSSISAAGRKLGKNPLSGAFPLISVGMILVVLILTKSRTPLVDLLVAIFLSLSLSSIKFSGKYIIIGVFVVSVTFFNVPAFQDAVFSVANIFDSSIGEDQNGSSLEMRSGQFNAAMNYFADDFTTVIFGNGMSATRNIIASEADIALYNAESLVFTVMIDQGLSGLFVYAWVFFQSIILAFKYIEDRSSRSILLGAIVGYLVFVVSTGIQETLSLFLALYSMVVLRWQTYYREGGDARRRCSRV